MTLKSGRLVGDKEGKKIFLSTAIKFQNLVLAARSSVSNEVRTCENIQAIKNNSLLRNVTRFDLENSRGCSAHCRKMNSISASF